MGQEAQTEPTSGAGVGQITCERASQSPGPGLHVTIPVSAWLPDSWKDRVKLTVTAVLHSPRGYPVPVAHAPTPSAQYIDRRVSASGSAGVTVGVAQLSGGLSRPVGAEELVVDVTGNGTNRITWVIDGKGRELAGSYDFGFEVPEAANRYAWVEVTVQLKALKGRFFSRPPVLAGEAATAAEPLLDKDAAQAGVTLTLLEGSPDRGERFFVGRPLDLPLTVRPDGFGVTRGSGAVTTGTIRWDDDFGGRAGYTWVQTAPSPVVQVGEGPAAGTGMAPVLIEPGSELRVPGGMSLTATYDIAQAPEWARESTMPSALLEVDVVIDGTVAATHRTQADYITVGRSHRDISIDLPNISRSHGSFELRSNGWMYCHQNPDAEAQVLRGDHVLATVRQDGAAAVEPGDVVLLTSDVSLVLR